jgi:glycosyltransferase involved in cell wall biosynthesis
VKSKDKLKVAIVCDWLTGIGGAEQVVLELHRIFPEAPIYTSQYDPSKISWFNSADVRTTWVNKLPKSLKKFLPVLRALSFARLDLSDYDLILSSSGAEAKAVKVGPNSIHICYCHSPTHYYWLRYEAYLANPGFGSLDWLARTGLKVLVGPMRKWDYKAAQKPNYLIANSNYTKANILKYYNRESSVIFPPVDINKYASKGQAESKRKGFVITGRQTPYKHVDLAVAACTKLNLDLDVIGTGPDNKKLRAMAGPTIKFLGQASDEIKAVRLQSAQAFIFPGVDDFGISAVEALAAGTPVIAYKGGGSLDYINTSTGLFFDKQTVAELCRTLEKFKRTQFETVKIKKFSQSFSPVVFKENITSFINNL